MTKFEHLESLIRDALADPRPPAHAIERAKRLMPGPLATACAALIERARELVADRLLDSRARPSLAGFRGSGAGFQFLYTQGRREVFIDVRAPGASGGDFHVQGQVEVDGAPVGSAAVLAIQAPAGDPVRESLTDAGGVFVLMLPGGRYDLALGLDPPFLVPGVALE